MNYDQDNVFAKIIRKEISVDFIYETPYALAFHDIQPKAPIHILVIPKGFYMNYSHFIDNASTEEIIGFNKALNHVIQTFELDKTGFRLITNQGSQGGQEVPHLHFHLLGGKFLGAMIQES